MIIFVPVLPPNKDFEDHFVHMLLALNVGVHCKQVLQIVFSPLELPDFRLQMAVNKYISKYVHCVWGMVIVHACIPSPTDHIFCGELTSALNWTQASRFLTHYSWPASVSVRHLLQPDVKDIRAASEIAKMNTEQVRLLQQPNNNSALLILIENWKKHIYYSHYPKHLKEALLSTIWASKPGLQSSVIGQLPPHARRCIWKCW